MSAKSHEPLWVQSRFGAYQVRVLDGAIDQLVDAVRAASTGRVIIVADAAVASLYPDFAASLQRVAASTRVVTFPPGEASKDLRVVEELWASILDGPLDRQDTVVAFGGGVAGDIAGFLAATLLRGVALVVVPTTVLAMADAAIGGKNGFNFAGAKNQIGTFYAPKEVIAWIPSLTSLPARELRSGLAEVAKSAIIAGEEAFQHLERDLDALVSHDPDALHRAVRMAARLKAEIVSRDEVEGGVRRHLNLGHTFAHAIESATTYGTWTHGEAVSVGLCMAAQYADSIGLAPGTVAERVRAWLDAVGLPTMPPKLTTDQWMHAMGKDKKREIDAVRLVLPRDFGDTVDQPVALAQLGRWIERHH